MAGSTVNALGIGFGPLKGPDVALGGDSEHNGTGLDSTAVGTNATAAGNSGTSLGDDSAANANYSTVLGAFAYGDGLNSTVVGRAAGASGNFSTVVGESAGDGGFADASVFGQQATVTGILAVALGRQSRAFTSSVAVGGGALADGNTCVAVGYQAEGGDGTGFHSYGTAVGGASHATSYQSTALGYGSQATEFYTTALGALASASAINGTAVGMNAGVGHPSGTCVGAGAHDNGYGTDGFSVAVGTSAVAGQYGVAVGAASQVTANTGIAIGYFAQAQYSNSIALGYNAAPQAAGECHVSVANLRVWPGTGGSTLTLHEASGAARTISVAGGVLVVT